MKLFIAAVCIFACAYASSVEQSAQVLHSNYDLNPNNNFVYGYETENGIKGQASGQIKAVGKDEVALEVSGSYSYESPEGQQIGVSYVADENGYQPQGAHLPTPPPPQPIPEYIQKALAYIEAHPYTEKN